MHVESSPERHRCNWIDPTNGKTQPEMLMHSLKKKRAWLQMEGSKKTCLFDSYCRWPKLESMTRSMFHVFLMYPSYGKVSCQLRWNSVTSNASSPLTVNYFSIIFFHTYTHLIHTQSEWYTYDIWYIYTHIFVVQLYILYHFLHVSLVHNIYMLIPLDGPGRILWFPWWRVLS